MKEERISIQDSDSKWSWLTNELAEKYFISVLLPYYIIRPKLHREDLHLLGFQGFLSRLKRGKENCFSDIKIKYMNLDALRQIEFLIEKFGRAKANKKLEDAKNRLENITDTIPRSTLMQNRDKIKLFLDLGFSPIKCKECDIGIELLIAIHLHHPTDSKEIILKDLYIKSKKEYKLLLEKFKKDKVVPLCGNHHLEKQMFYPIEFENIIFKEDLFSMSSEEIDDFINDYLSAFNKTERYKEIIYEKYTSQNLEVPRKIIIKWKFQIKKWIKKRFVFNELFNGKCVNCGDSNLMHLDLHHTDPKLKALFEKWQSIASLDCDEIMRIIIQDKCVCLCSNCHALITRKYHISIREILKGYFPQQEIDKISENLLSKYNTIIEKILNFKYDIANINFKDPLKLDFCLEDLWKIHLMTIYYYLEMKERSFFYRNEILYDLELLPSFINSSIKRLVDIDYVQKFDFLIKYILTETGKDKVLKLIQEFNKKAGEVRKSLEECLSNKGKYDFLDCHRSKFTKLFVLDHRYSEDKINLKYCIIIYDLIIKKGINEFTIEELIQFFRVNGVNITQDLCFKLITFNLIEKKNTNELKIFKFAEKGFDIVKNGFKGLGISKTDI